MSRVAPADVLPAACYLLTVVGVLLVWRRCPAWLHLAALAAGVPIRVGQAGWVQPLVALGAAGAVFVVGVLLAAQLVSGVTLLSLVTAVALLPPAGWPGLGVGLAVAGLVATWRVARSAGMGRVTLLATQVLHGLGLRPGGIGVPDLDHLPTRAQTTAMRPGPGSEARLERTYLPPYLLVGLVVFTAVCAAW